MASVPDFASTVLVGTVVVPATADVNAMGATGPTHVTQICQAGATGAKIEEIDVIQIANTGATGGRINIWRSVSAANNPTGPFYLVDQFLVSPATANATTLTTIVPHYYSNLFLQASDVLSCSIMETQNQSNWGVNAYSGSF